MNFPSDNIAAPATGVGAGSITLNNGSDYPTSGFVLINGTGGVTSELVEYASRVGNVLTLSTPTVSAHGLAEIVDFVDVISDNAETGQRRFKIQNPPIVRNTERIFEKPPAAPWKLLLRDVDYIINRGTGEFEFIDLAGVFAGSQLVTSYDFYTNLVAQVQKVLEGDINDPNSFPGVKAAGIILSVETPTIKRITVVASISAEDGFSEVDLAPLVQEAMESYIDSRGIGEDIIRSRLIDVAHNVDGVRDVIISDPVGNITVLENNLPVSFDVNGVSLVVIL